MLSCAWPSAYEVGEGVSTSFSCCLYFPNVPIHNWVDSVHLHSIKVLKQAVVSHDLFSGRLESNNLLTEMRRKGIFNILLTFHDKACIHLLTKVIEFKFYQLDHQKLGVSHPLQPH